MLRELEDLGFEAVDNPPLTMLEEMVARSERRLGIGIHARSRGFDVERAAGRLQRLALARGGMFYGIHATAVILRVLCTMIAP